MPDPRPAPSPAPDLPPQPAPQPNPDRPDPTRPSPSPDLPNYPQPQGAAELPPAAQRALAEARERRERAEAQALPPELGGRDGPEPVRYGDWEKKGIAVDF